MKMTAYLWAFVATVLNDFVLATPPQPLSFRRDGDGEYKVIHLDYDRPGWATCQVPTGERTPTQLTDDELGIVLKAYGDAKGLRFELPQGAENAREQAASASGGAGFGHP